MVEKRAPRRRQQVLLAGIAAALIVTLPVLDLGLPFLAKETNETTPTEVVQTGESGTVSIAGENPEAAEPDESVFDFEVSLDAGVPGTLNRGEVLSRAVTEHVGNMARTVADAVPIFIFEVRTAYVASATAAAYVSPSEEAPHVIAFRRGDSLTVTGVAEGWVRIQYQGNVMYVLEKDVTDDMVFVPVDQTLYVLATAEEDLKLYAAPSRDAEVLKEIWFADRVTAVESSPEWFKVVTEAKVEGYLPASILTEDVVFAQGSYKMYCLQDLAVYIQPDPDTEVVHYYDEDDAVQVTGYSFDWIRVVTSDDETGYIQMEKVTESAPYTPPAYTPPTYTPKPQTTFTPGTYANASVQTVINKAMSYVGCAYVLGGTGYGGIDCSGLTMRAYEAAGIYITRSSYAYWGVGYGVSFSDLRPGDIVCYDSEWNGTIGHVAIYIGNGQVVHAMNEWRGVGVSSVYFGGYNILTVRRIIG